MDCNWAGVRIGAGPSSFLAVGMCVGALRRAVTAATVGGVDLALSMSLVTGCPFLWLSGLDLVGIDLSVTVVSSGGPGQGLLVPEGWVLSAALGLYLDLLGVFEETLSLCRQYVPFAPFARRSLTGGLGCSSAV